MSVNLPGGPLNHRLPHEFTSKKPGRFPPWVVVTYVLSILAVLGLWLNVGILYPPNAGPYAIALSWALCIFGFIFVRTIELFLHRAPNN